MNVVIVISVTIGFIVIFQAMYTAVMERTREIGILKSMGASKFYIVNVILRETLMLAMGGIMLGILISLAARAGIAHKIPTLRVVVTGGWISKTTTDCDRRGDAGRLVSGVPGGAEGPDRGFGVRIMASSRGSPRNLERTAVTPAIR